MESYSCILKYRLGVGKASKIRPGLRSGGKLPPGSDAGIKSVRKTRFSAPAKQNTQGIKMVLYLKIVAFLKFSLIVGNKLWYISETKTKIKTEDCQISSSDSSDQDEPVTKKPCPVSTRLSRVTRRSNPPCTLPK